MAVSRAPSWALRTWAAKRRPSASDQLETVTALLSVQLRLAVHASPRTTSSGLHPETESAVRLDDRVAKTLLVPAATGSATYERPVVIDPVTVNEHDPLEMVMPSGGYDYVYPY